MPKVLRHSLTQRADYTQKHNAKLGRYGWLRLTPAYSLKIVSEILTTYNDTCKVNVLDPFCGTGTTALCAAYHGQAAVTIEINPFLVWFSRTKIDSYSQQSIADVKKAVHAVLEDVNCKRTEKAPIPSMHNIGRWWAPAHLDFLRSLKGAIDIRFPKGTKQHSLFSVAFCRTLINLSNAAFNHQSMSFKSDFQTALNFDVEPQELFRRDLTFVLEGRSEIQ